MLLKLDPPLGTKSQDISASFEFQIFWKSNAKLLDFPFKKASSFVDQTWQGCQVLHTAPRSAVCGWISCVQTNAIYGLLSLLLPFSALYFIMGLPWIKLCMCKIWRDRNYINQQRFIRYFADISNVCINIWWKNINADHPKITRVSSPSSLTKSSFLVIYVIINNIITWPSSIKEIRKMWIFQYVRVCFSSGKLPLM